MVAGDFSTVVVVRTCTPSAASACVMIAEARGSAAGSSRGAVSISVTWLPRRAKAWASSQPIAPPPKIASRPGGSVSSKMVSLVR